MVTTEPMVISNPVSVGYTIYGHTSEAILQLARSSQPLVFHLEVLGEIVQMCAVEQIMLVKKWIKSVTCTRCYEIHTHTVHDNIAQGSGDVSLDSFQLAHICH